MEGSDVFEDVGQVLGLWQLVRQSFHQDFEEHEVVLTRRLEAKIRGGLLKCTGVQGHAAPLCVLENVVVCLIIVRLPGQLTEFSLEQLVGFHLGEEVEEDDAEDDLLGFLRALFDHLANDVLAGFVQYAEDVTESQAT